MTSQAAKKIERKPSVPSTTVANDVIEADILGVANDVELDDDEESLHAGILEEFVKLQEQYAGDVHRELALEYRREKVRARKREWKRKQQEQEIARSTSAVVMKVCPVCEKAFEVPETGAVAKKVYCSSACSHAAHARRKQRQNSIVRAERGTQVKVCAVCETMFTVSVGGRDANKVYCGEACSSVAKVRRMRRSDSVSTATCTKVCPVCGTVFSVSDDSRGANKAYCGERCSNTAKSRRKRHRDSVLS